MVWVDVLDVVDTFFERVEDISSLEDEEIEKIVEEFPTFNLNQIEVVFTGKVYIGVHNICYKYRTFFNASV